MIVQKKVLNLLPGSSAYQVLAKGPAPSLKRRIKRVAALPGKLYYHLRSSAGKTPLLYGLPKIHKPDIPEL